MASVKAFGSAMDTMEISADNFNDAIKQATSLGPSFNSATLTLVNTVAMLSSQFDISDDAAYGLGKRLNDLAKNPSPQSVSLLVDYMKSLKPTTQDGAEAITNLEKKILDAAAAMQQAHDNGESLRKTLDGLKTEAQQANFDGISKQLEAQRIALTKGKQAAIEYGIEQQDLTREQKDQLIALSRTNAQLAEEKEKRDKASKAGLKQAAATESVSLKLEQLRKRSELSGESTAELSREQAILTAQQSLGKAATKEQIALAGQYAAKTWDAANALKKRSQAEQARRFTDQEIATNKTTPDAITGAVADPTALINLQEQQKLAALAQYQQMGVLSAQQFEDTKTAIQEQASNARKRIAQDEANSQMAATVSMLNAASLGFDSLAGIISGAAGKASSAYIAMFAAAKSFAIASATLDFNGALLKALNAPDSLTTAQRFANYAAVASAGASVLSNIASVSMSGGRRYGGTVSAGNAYRINEDGRSEIFQTAGGQQAFIPNQSGKIIPADKVGGGGGVVQHITFEINTTGGIDDATMAKMAQMMKQVSLNTIRDQQRPNGLLRR